MNITDFSSASQTAIGYTLNPTYAPNTMNKCLPLTKKKMYCIFSDTLKVCRSSPHPFFNPSALGHWTFGSDAVLYVYFLTSCVLLHFQHKAVNYISWTRKSQNTAKSRGKNAQESNYSPANSISVN